MHVSDYIVTGKLTDREIKKLQKDIDIYRQKVIAATVGSKGQQSRLDESFRKCAIYFPKAFDFPNTFNILQSTILEHYGEVCDYLDYSDMAEVQYAKYEESNFFKKHKDTIYGHDILRTLTFSINVSDEGAYEDGELIVYDGDDEYALGKEKGSFIIFPAFMFHEAKEVKNGTREAIVTWVRSTKEPFEKFKKEVSLIAKDVN